jgi:hypothetical protein
VAGESKPVNDEQENLTPKKDRSPAPKGFKHFAPKRMFVDNQLHFRRKVKTAFFFELGLSTVLLAYFS